MSETESSPRRAVIRCDNGGELALEGFTPSKVQTYMGEDAVRIELRVTSSWYSANACFEVSKSGLLAFADNLARALREQPSEAELTDDTQGNFQLNIVLGVRGTANISGYITHRTHADDAEVKYSLGAVLSDVERFLKELRVASDL